MEPSTDDLACQQLVELITDYLEDALVASERARFEQHLAACLGCTAYLAQMQRMVLLLGRRPQPALQPDEQQRLLALFRGLSQAPRH